MAKKEEMKLGPEIVAKINAWARATHTTFDLIGAHSLAAKDRAGKYATLPFDGGEKVVASGCYSGKTGNAIMVFGLVMPNPRAAFVEMPLAKWDDILGPKFTQELLTHLKEQGLEMKGNTIAEIDREQESRERARMMSENPEYATW